MSNMRLAVVAILILFVLLVATTKQPRVVMLPMSCGPGCTAWMPVPACDWKCDFPDKP